MAPAHPVDDGGVIQNTKWRLFGKCVVCLLESCKDYRVNNYILRISYQ